MLVMFLTELVAGFGAQRRWQEAGMIPVTDLPTYYSSRCLRRSFEDHRGPSEGAEAKSLAMCRRLTCNEEV